MVISDVVVSRPVVVVVVVLVVLSSSSSTSPSGVRSSVLLITESGRGEGVMMVGGGY